MGKSGMLGGGVYFAPNPQKSTNYSPDHKMLLCRVNLQGSKYAQNQIFEEYCIYDVIQALPMYVITWR